MSIQQYLERQQRIIDEATAVAEILKKLPRDLDVSSVFQSHGAWYVSVSSGTSGAIAALRPLAIEVRKDGWNQPAAKVQDWFAADGDLCFPVGFRGTELQAFWYSKLDDGTPLTLCGPREDVTIPRGYALVHGDHLQFFRRAYKFPQSVAPREVEGDAACEIAAKAAVVELESLFQGPLVKRKTRIDVEVLSALLTAKLGYSVTVSERLASSRGEGLLAHTFWVTVGRWHEGWTVTLSTMRDADGYDFEYPQDAQYGEATPLLPALS